MRVYVSHRLDTLIVLLAVSLLLGGAVPCGGSESVPDGTDETLTREARTFVELFLEGDIAQLHGRMTARMQSGFPPDVAAQIRQDLFARMGSVTSIGEAWMEDVVENYTRFRVPTEFDKDTIDFRVVFDAEGKVAGFFHVPHVPAPAERAADESLQSEPRPEFEGHWQGSIEIPGASLGVLVELLHKEGYWVGTIDIPAQGAQGLPLSGIRITEMEVEFVIDGVPGEPAFVGALADGKITGTFTQRGQGFPFHLGREIVDEPRRPQEPDQPYPYSEEEVAFGGGEVTLAGTLTLPAGDGPYPAVLLISGSGPQNRDEEIFGHKPFLVLSDHLTRVGIAVLRVDDRGVGESTGDFVHATSEDFAEDALAGVEFLLARPEIDPERIGLIGHSEGGVIAPMVASRSRAVSFLVLLAGPGVPGDEILIRQMELISRAAGMEEEQVARVISAQRTLLDLVKGGAVQEEVEAQIHRLIQAQTGADSTAEEIQQEAAAQARRVTSPWFRFFLRHDPLHLLERTRVPVLALCGELDLQVDPRQNLPAIREALMRGGNPDYTAMELPGLNHLFQEAGTGSPTEYYSIEETFNPAALDAISDWILERFAN
ncbi:MAG: alpha/beta fold hydrolase [Candidatus Eisenbacteria bacterium]